MAILRLFASAREAAGTGKAEVDGATVGQVLDEARRRFGTEFVDILGHSRVWLNGEPTDDAAPVGAEDVVAVLPPVSGGAVEAPTQSSSPPPTQPLSGEEAAAPAPIPSPETSRSRTLPPLAVVPEVDGPHGRLGLVWALVTIVLAVAGQLWLAVWFGATAFAAASQTGAAWRRRGERPLVVLAAATGAALVLAAAWSIDAMVEVVVVAMAVAVVARAVRPTIAPARDIGVTLLIGLVIGLAAAAPVLLRERGLSPVLVLLALAAAYDAGNYIVGTGASTPWEGPAAGIVSMVPVTMVVAVVLAPPFRGASPYLLALLAATLAPLGPLAGSALLGDRDAPAPALRRLDSLLLLGPLWAWSAAALLR